MEIKLEEANRRIEDLESKQSEERWHTLFEYAPDACYLSTLTGTFIDGNRKAEQLTGYNRDELIGKNFLKLRLLNRGDIVKAGKLLAFNALKQATGPDEFQIRTKDNHWITLEISTFPVKVGHRSLVLGIGRDVTERKRNEQELQKYRNHLETMVQMRTADLETTNKQLQKEVDERQKWLKL